VADFEKHRPDVLVLAFNSLEKAERYYLGLYRLGRQVHGIPHRTVILCNKDDLRRTYELCRRQYFDDYVLFWPATNDAPRLPMAVHHALRSARGDAPREIALQARRIAELEARLAQYEALGVQHAESAKHALFAAARDIEGAVDGVSERIAGGELRDVVEVRDRAGLHDEFARLKRERIAPPLRAVEESVAPVAAWASGLRAAVAPQLDAARKLAQAAAQMRPAVLVVDDDPFQHRLLAQLLPAANVELHFATSAEEAFALVRRRRPDMILMDIDLPDMNGIDAMRHLKAVEAFAGIQVLMISGHSEKQLVIDAVRARAADYMIKPLDRDKLLAKLQKFMGAAP
jgi:CheY-like chemotaxis protein